MCHKEVAIHRTSRALHLRKSLEVSSGNSARFPHVPTGGHMFVSACLPGQQTLVVPPILMDLWL